MDTTRRDTHFRAQTKAEPIRKSRRTVLEDTSSVHSSQELLPNVAFFTAHNGFSVPTSVLVDPINRSVDTLNDFDHAGQITILTFELFSRRVTETDFHGRGASETFHTRGPQLHQSLCCDAILDSALVHQKSLHRVTGRRIIRLGIYGDPGSGLSARRRIYVDMAHPICMSKHRNASVGLYIRHQIIASSWDHQVNHVIQG
mmetsp:Transcript_66949/g.193491  ORF Transcript_66949/g.193491 Transcript_66949/m.193491 type:complete len:201 (-) Transcript_66949:2145-2747(-)